MGYCFMTLEKVKTNTAMATKYQHNYRIATVPNADINKQDLNEELVMLNGKTYIEAFDERIRSLQHYKDGYKVRKNAVLAFEVVTTFSREDAAHVDLERWKEKNVEWAKSTFNANKEYGENVVSVMYHGDECGNVHCHMCIVPIDHKGVLNASYYTDGRATMIAMQDSYGEAMKEFGLERGLKGSVAKHEDIKQFYTSLNREIAKELPAVQRKGLRRESAEEYKERASEVFKTSNLQHLSQMNKMKRRIVEATTYDLQDKITIGKEHSIFENKIKALESEVGQYDELERVFGSFATIEAKLTTQAALDSGMALYGKAYPSEQQEMHDMAVNMNKVIRWKKAEDAKKKDKVKSEFEVNKEDNIEDNIMVR